MRGYVPVFVGPVWVSGRLHPGGVGVTWGWREQLEPDMRRCWKIRRRSGCPRTTLTTGDFVRYCTERGWDYSVSVTHAVSGDGGFAVRVESVRRFAGLRLTGPLSDETTILNFRYLLEAHGLGEVDMV